LYERALAPIFSQVIWTGPRPFFSQVTIYERALSPIFS
jgi:hypothetical protein